MSDGDRARLELMYDRLMAVFGPQRWWPGDTPFEIMVGAVLTQNTSWSNVEKAISNLKARELLEPERLNRLSEKKLAGLIRPAGYFNLKARRLKNLVELVVASGGGDPPALLEKPLRKLREDLLSVNGVGPETADSILLYAAGYPVFVIDAYTRRILARHDLVKGDETYEGLQNFFMQNLSPDPILYNEYHALLVRLGKYFCKPKPRCSQCPLEQFLTPGQSQLEDYP